MNASIKIDAPMRTLLRWLGAAHLLILLLIVGGAVAYTHVTKGRIARQLAQSLRTEIITGDYRDALLIASTAVGSNFNAISFESRDGSIAFSVPVGSMTVRLNSFVSASKRIDIYFGNQVNSGPTLGNLVFVFDRFDLVPEALAIWILFLVIGTPAYWLAYKTMEKRHTQDLEAKNAMAIARTTTMLAHDIRKPFSMLKIGLGMLSRAADPAGVKAVLAKVVPEIDRATGHVNGMLEDLLEVGSNSTQLIQEAASPEALIEQTLGDIFRVYPKADVSISYDFGHTHTVNVHVQKVARVFSNIVGNAVQAMNYKGRIWFATREVVVSGNMLVEFTLGNAGSVIPTENLAKLFDAFFTSGKKGGTGLGLAIAQKVVTAHGGQIWCESSRTPEHPEGKVEFKFTLPIANEHEVRTKGDLARHSSEITKGLLANGVEPTASMSHDSTELSLEADIIALAKAKGRPVRVLVVDDEVIYRSGLACSLARTPDLAAAVTIEEAKGNVEGLVLLANRPDLLITDVDMGHELDGFDLVKDARSQGYLGLVCIHSNRMITEDHRTAIYSGADAFISKPASRAQLLKLVIQAGQKSSVARQGATVKESGVTIPEVLVIDDNIFVLEAWEDILRADAVVHTIANQEALIKLIGKNPLFLERLSLVVTDFNFDGSSYNGQDVARLIKSYRPTLPVLLSSDGLFADGELSGPDRVIGKEPVSLAELQT